MEGCENTTGWEKMCRRWLFSVSRKQELEHSGKGNLEMNRRVWLGTEEASQGMIMALRLPESWVCLDSISGMEWDSLCKARAPWQPLWDPSES